MATTVAAIAKEALDAVAAEVTGVIHSVTVARVTNGEVYDPATGTYPTTNSQTTGRAVAESEAAIRDAFPDYVVEKATTLWMLEGLEWSPQEGDRLIVTGGATGSIVAVRDLLRTGELFRVLVV